MELLLAAGVIAGAYALARSTTPNQPEPQAEQVMSREEPTPPPSKWGLVDEEPTPRRTRWGLEDDTQSVPVSPGRTRAKSPKKRAKSPSKAAARPRVLSGRVRTGLTATKRAHTVRPRAHATLYDEDEHVQRLMDATSTRR